jgi:hypothetical protein
VVRCLLVRAVMSRFMFAALLAACTSQPSPFPTGLEPQIFLNSFNSQLRVNVGLQGTTDVDVDATFRGQTVVGTLDHQGGGTGYLLLFDIDHPIAADEPVLITVDGIEMTITAPPPFDDVQVPPSISRSQPTTIGWATTSPDPMSWMVETSTCAAGYGSIAPNAASLTLTATDWLPGDDPNATCMTTVRLLRDRTGTLDPAFADSAGNELGSLMFEQYDDVSFTSTP